MVMRHNHDQVPVNFLSSLKELVHHLSEGSHIVLNINKFI